MQAPTRLILMFISILSLNAKALKQTLMKTLYFLYISLYKLKIIMIYACK